MYDLTKSAPVYLKTFKEEDILKKQLPKLSDVNKIDTTRSNQTDTIQQKELQLLSLMNEIYKQSLNNWLEDYKIILKSKVIGARFPKVIVMK